MISNIIVLPKYHIPQLGVHRKLFIYLPPDYDNSCASYPVLYMHDGQNLFHTCTSFAGEWRVDEKLDSLYYGCGKGVIVIGVENGYDKRIAEYTPKDKGRMHAEFIATVLKPDIDSKFRTLPERKHTFIGGSSLGGLMSLYTANQYPDLFGGVAALSPAMSFAGDELAELKMYKDTKIYIDVGLKEDLYYITADDYTRQCTAIYQRLLQSGYEKMAMIYDADGAHNEAAWCSRFGYIARYLFT